MSQTQIEFTVENTGERLDKLIVARLPELSRSQIQAMIKEGQVTVDGEQVKAGVKLRGGEQVLVIIPVAAAEAELEPEDIPLEVLYEDDDIAVINKTAGMVVHPAAGNPSGTLVNALLARWPQIQQMDDAEGRNGIVHRLDKDTSGVMVIAKNDDALEDLMWQFQERLVDKTYVALLERRPATDTGRIDAPIGRDPKRRKRMAVVYDGREAVTEFKVIDDHFREGQALVEFDLLTGRTHQIRVHAMFINCPIVGDRVYGYRKQRVKLKRNFLHAAKIAFDHPSTGDRVEFEAPMPIALQQIMQKLR